LANTWDDESHSSEEEVFGMKPDSAQKEGAILMRDGATPSILNTSNGP